LLASLDAPRRAAILLFGCLWLVGGVATDAAKASDGTGGTSPLPVLRVASEAEVHSVLVRVRDVVEPLTRAPRGWEALADKPLALLPADGRRLRMDRQRIIESIQRSGLLREPVRYSGDRHVGIRYVTPPALGRLETPSAGVTHSQPGSATTGVRVVSSQRPVTPAATSAVTHPAQRSGSPAAAPAPALLPAERHRIERLVLAAFERTHASLLESYQVQLATHDVDWGTLGGLQGVRSLRLAGAPREGNVELVVAGETETELVEATVTLQLRALPEVVVASQNLQRGDILSARDVKRVPMPPGQAGEDYLTDAAAVVGKELTRAISRDRPIGINDISEPIVIERNDVVELRSISPGIVATTTAKSLGRAAVGEQVLVELQSPKRRLHARAVGYGVVEIVTRPQMAGKSQ
jgi:flagella basal body P-ring formation protein FlgA